MAIFHFASKCCVPREELCAASGISPGRGTPHTCVSGPITPSCLGWKTFQDARGHKEGGRGDVPSFSYPYIVLIRVKINWGLKVNWYPEIKILIDILRQDVFLLQIASHSQGQPQSAPRVSEGLVRHHPCLPGSKKHIRVIFVLSNPIHGIWIITEFLFGGGKVLGRRCLHFSNNTLL